MLDILPVLASLLGSAAMSPALPIRLEAETSAGSSTVRVIGESPIECGASYTLEVSDRHGGNRSVTGGTANLVPGKRQTLATVTLGGAAATTVATLRVQPCAGAAYEQVWPQQRD